MTNDTANDLPPADDTACPGEAYPDSIPPSAPPPQTQPDPMGLFILDLLGACAPAHSVTPEDVARAWAARQAPAGSEWRPMLKPVRKAAIALAEQEQIEILRKGKPVAPDQVKGVIRLRAKG